MEEMYLEGESEIQIQSEGIDEAVTYMKQTLHDMKLQDAIHRQDIRKLEKGNSKMEEKIEKLKKNIDQLEKQKTTDTQYLLKQNEFLTKVLMAKKIDASNEETGKPNTKTTDTHKERLKNKKESVKRTKELVDITNELEYKSSSILGEAQQLNQDIEQVEKYPEEHRSAIVKSLFMNMMNLMENLDSASKVSDYKGDTSALSQNTSTLNKSESKLAKQDVLDCKISNDNDIIKKQIEDIDFRTSVIKKMRISAQKDIFEIEKKLDFIEKGVPEEQKNEVELLRSIDLNKEATLTNHRTNEILANLKEKLETNATGDVGERRLIKELSSRDS
ncbi:unnamed protein product [Moneuplotes crassus]|uniref:Uncharacterized protein n=2 Tax=Euplotes crassus TaxID=5936 RepID=A0AAD1US09_EUPCR|nr:unnamed protein product [Moneuplotes crassus]